MNINKDILNQAIIKSGGFNVLWAGELILNAAILVVYFTINIDVFVLYIVMQFIFFAFLGAWFIPFMYQREESGHFNFKKEIQHLEKNDVEIINKLNVILQKLQEK